MYSTVMDIRNEFKRKFLNEEFVKTNREASMDTLVGNSTLEIVGTSFIADEDVIFGKLSYDYIAKEEKWYNSMSLNVNDIPGGAPAIWKSVADKDGFINSNYGYLIYSEKNHNQYLCAFHELSKNPESRRAIMIYTRPSIWYEYNENGRSDFICTNTVQYLIRDGKLTAVVNMRSQDSIFGHKNDRHFQLQIQTKLAKDLNVDVGDLIWQTGSLHVYSRHFFLVDHFAKTGEIHISKEDYLQKYPNSPFV